MNADTHAAMRMPKPAFDPAADSYSYQGQDRFVVEVLGGLRGGFFLDSGASNGVRGNNSLLLETRYGWDGICIEPNAAMYADLAIHRHCRTYQCCLYDRDGEAEFLEGAGVFGGLLETYSAQHLAFARTMIAEGDPELRNPSHRRLQADAALTAFKPVRTLLSLLRESNAPRVIDYWSLDTEGSELAILRSFPFDEYRFRVLTVEHNHEPVREAIHAFLASHGYVRVRELGIDDGYVHGEDGGDRAWRSAAWRSRHQGAKR